MLPDRLFRKLDRARLSVRELRRHEAAWTRDLAALRAAREAYVADGRVPPLSRAAQTLINGLSQVHGVPRKRVVLRDRPRPHKRRGGRVVYELHGLCDPAGPLEVYTRTAVRAQPVALKTMLETLYHEWIHHWDFSCFGASVHSSGFYERVGQLYRPSRDWLSDPAPTPPSGAARATSRSAKPARAKSSAAKAAAAPAGGRAERFWRFLRGS